jgi:hypothetical protein
MTTLEKAARDALELCERIIAGKRIWSLSDMRVVSVVLREALEQTEPVVLDAEIVHFAKTALHEMPRPATDWHHCAKRVCQAVVALDQQQAEPVVDKEQAEPSYFGLTHDHTWLEVDKAQYDKLKPRGRMACVIRSEE